MNETLKVGRVAGMPVGFNWSVLLGFALVVFGLAAGRLPRLEPEVASAVHVVTAVVAAGLFVGSLVLHQVARALTARGQGLEVGGLTVWLFGGVTKLSHEVRDPVVELKIATIGPVVSLAVALVLGSAAGLLNIAGAPATIGGILAWIAAFNVALAAFNLLPVASLDGGRILRALLWRYRGDRTAAQLAVAAAGRVLGWGLIVLGVLEFAIGGGVGRLWFVLAGWLLVVLARTEQRVVEGGGGAALRSADHS